MEGISIAEILHVVGQSLRTPCIIILLILIVAAVWQIGDVLVEFFIERRKTKENVPALIKKMEKMTPEEIRSAVEGSAILKKQKHMLDAILDTSDLSPDARATFAQKLLDDESLYFEDSNRICDLVAKIGPMFGLLGTLIPLGPGIVALGQGDTQTLSDSLSIAFDTTIAGLISAAVCSVIAGIRRRWYDDYMSSSEAMAEMILERMEKAGEESE